MRALLVALLVMQPACAGEPTTPPRGEAAPTIHAVLHVGSDTAFVLITRPPPLPEQPRAAGVSGVRVSLLHDGHAVLLPEAPAGFPDCVRDAAHWFSDPPAAGAGCYAARLPRPIRAGERYELLAELPGGTVARGVAVVPDLPGIQRPDERERFVVRHDPSVRGVGEWTAEIPVTWRAGPGGEFFDVNLVIEARLVDGMRLPGASCPIQFRLDGGARGTRGDSATFRLLDVDCFEGTSNREPWDSLHARVLVTAFDTAYARYAEEVHRRESVRLDRASAGLEGALGLFAGAASAAREITLVAGN